MGETAINFQCRHYRASRPCDFNKLYGAECPSCHHVSEFRERILFIKLDAIGDVLRSGGLLPAIAARHQAPYIAWLTRREASDLVRMMAHVDEVLELSDEVMARLAADRWDYVYSLSNDLPSAALASLAAAKKGRVGYWLEGGKIEASNPAAAWWLEMAAFDRLKKANTESYQRLMLNIIGDDREPQAPVLRVPRPLQDDANARVAAVFPDRSRSRVAVNVGAGGRWPKKMLDAASLAAYIGILLTRGDVDVMLVGGAAEMDKTRQVMALCDDPRVHAFLTPKSIPEFVAILTTADVLFCGDTLALHIATAIGLPAIAIFGPTSVAEIADFEGLVEKIVPAGMDCLCCYGDCTKTSHCMSQLDLEYLADRTLLRCSQVSETIEADLAVASVG